MKNFDEQRRKRLEQDRGFTIGGETFIRRPSVRPEAVSPWEAVASNPAMSNTDILAAIDETIINLIEPGEKGEAHKRWHKLREREEDALNLGDMIDVITWLVEEQAQRPTQPSSDSSSEPGTTETPSTDGSSSPGLQAVSAA